MKSGWPSSPRVWGLVASRASTSGDEKSPPAPPGPPPAGPPRSAAACSALASCSPCFSCSLAGSSCRPAGAGATRCAQNYNKELGRLAAAWSTKKGTARSLRWTPLTSQQASRLEPTLSYNNSWLGHPIALQQSLPSSLHRSTLLAQPEPSPSVTHPWCRPQPRLPTAAGRSTPPPGASILWPSPALSPQSSWHRPAHPRSGTGSPAAVQAGGCALVAAGTCMRTGQNPQPLRAGGWVAQPAARCITLPLPAPPATHLGGGAVAVEHVVAGVQRNGVCEVLNCLFKVAGREGGVALSTNSTQEGRAGDQRAARGHNQQGGCGLGPIISVASVSRAQPAGRVHLGLQGVRHVA